MLSMLGGALIAPSDGSNKTWFNEEYEQHWRHGYGKAQTGSGNSPVWGNFTDTGNVQGRHLFVVHFSRSMTHHFVQTYEILLKPKHSNMQIKMYKMPKNSNKIANQEQTQHTLLNWLKKSFIGFQFVGSSTTRTNWATKVHWLIGSPACLDTVFQSRSRSVITLSSQVA